MNTSDINSQKNKPTILVKKQDLKNTLNDLKDTDADIVVTNESSDKNSLKYLSEIKDEKSGEISKPFKIKDKKYQIVRAIDKNKNKVTGVYSFDDMDNNGNNLIFPIDVFETTILGNDLETKKPSNETDKKQNNFIGYKHFIVNKTTGKARKFKTIEELAKANMDDNEEYMGIKTFKQYVDETLFGSRKTVKEDDTQNSSTDEKMIASAERLIDLIKSKIPSSIFQQIRSNQIAQREVILAFIDLIGVPKNQLSTIVSNIRQMDQNVNERKVINKILVNQINKNNEQL